VSVLTTKKRSSGIEVRLECVRVEKSWLRLWTNLWYLILNLKVVADISLMRLELTGVARLCGALGARPLPGQKNWRGGGLIYRGVVSTPPGRARVALFRRFLLGGRFGEYEWLI